MPARKLQAAADHLDVARQAAAADVDGADVQRAQAPGELPLVPRRGLEHPQGAGERGRHQTVEGEEGDPRIDLGRAELAGQVLDQARPGDGRVRVEQVLPRLAQRDAVAGTGRQADGALARQQHRGPAGAVIPGGGRGRQGGRPQYRLLEVTRLRDELGFPPGRDDLVADAGRSLDADGRHLTGQARAPVEGRFGLTRAEPPGCTRRGASGASRGVARAEPAGRVDEHRVEPVGGQSPSGQPQVAHVGHHRRDPVGPAVDGRVVQGEAGVPGVPVDREHGGGSGQRDQVAADAAAQVGHPGGAGQAPGPVGRDRLRRRLLVPGPGEQHGAGPAELGGGGAAQLLLGRRRGDQVGWVLPAQPLGQGQPGGGRARRRQPGQQLRARGDQQGGGFGRHPVEASARRLCLIRYSRRAARPGAARPGAARRRSARKLRAGRMVCAARKKSGLCARFYSTLRG